MKSQIVGMIRTHKNEAACLMTAIFWAALSLTALGAPLPQEGAAEKPKENQEAAKPEAKPAEIKPVAWGPFTVQSSFEVGYRGRSLDGSLDMFRSQLNMGRGLRLFAATLSMEAPAHSGKLWDKLYFSADNWGGDPNNSIRLRMEKADIYQLEFTYQNSQFYNSIPAFANPLLAEGSLTSQHVQDSGRHMIEGRLTLRPTALFRPYIAFSGNSSEGRGRTTYMTGWDDFVLRSAYRTRSDEYKFGVEFGRNRFGGFVEQSYRRFKEDWRITQIDGLKEGNSSNPVLGYPVFLTDLLRNDQLRGNAPVSRAFLRWAPAGILQLSGHATYVSSSQSFSEDQLYNGSFVSFSDRLVYPSKLDLVRSESSSPGWLVGANAEFKPLEWLSFTDSVQLNRFHLAGSGDALGSYFRAFWLSGPPGTVNPQVSEPLDGRIAFDTLRNTIDGVAEISQRASLRLGYRYQQQQVKMEERETFFGPGPELVKSVQHVPMVGMDFRVTKRLQLAAEFERGFSDNVLFRTMARDFTRVKVRARTQVTKFLRVNGFYNVYGRRNGDEAIDLTAHSNGWGVSASIAPGEKFSLTLDYQRSDLDSNLWIVLPQTLTRDRSYYAENGNYGAIHLEMPLPHSSRLTVGYSVSGTTGSFPVNFHQPYANLSIGLNRRVSWNSTWRYYGYNEKGASIEDYRSNLYSTGLAFHF